MTIPANTAVTVPPVNYTLDPTQDLLVAFDISNTSGEGNLRFGALTGADILRQDRRRPKPACRTGRQVTSPPPNNLYLIEKIEVL